jgi:hypothetical protein
MGFNSGLKVLIIASYYLQRKNMAPQAGMFFYGAICLTHSAKQAQTVNATCISDFIPIVKGPKKLVVEIQLWCCGYFTVLACLRDSGQFCHIRGGQTRIVVKSAHYIRGVPNTKKESPEIKTLLQQQPVRALSSGILDFLVEELFSKPCDNVY